MHPTEEREFQQFVYEFHVTRDYFECHEILEDFWKRLAPRNKQHEIVGFILLSTAMYHWRRQNFSGAIKSLKKAHMILKQVYPDELSILRTIDRDVFLKDLESMYQNAAEHKMYTSYTIPFTSNDLAALRKDETVTSVDPSVFHKHLTRDRTAVVQERDQARAERQQRKRHLSD